MSYTVLLLMERFTRYWLTGMAATFVLYTTSTEYHIGIGHSELFQFMQSRSGEERSKPMLDSGLDEMPLELGVDQSLQLQRLGEKLQIKINGVTVPGWHSISIGDKPVVALGWQSGRSTTRIKNMSLVVNVPAACDKLSQKCDNPNVEALCPETCGICTRKRLTRCHEFCLRNEKCTSFAFSDHPDIPKTLCSLHSPFTVFNIKIDDRYKMHIIDERCFRTSTGTTTLTSSPTTSTTPTTTATDTGTTSGTTTTTPTSTTGTTTGTLTETSSMTTTGTTSGTPDPNPDCMESPRSPRGRDDCRGACCVVVPR